MSRALPRAGFILLLLFIAVTPVLAQEGEPSPADSPVGWTFRWLNFAIIFGAIGYLVVKKGSPYFRAKSEEVSQKIREAARVRDVAEQRRREASTKLADLAHDVAQLRADAKRDTELEIEQLRAAMRDEGDKIERAAMAEIAAAERAARIELKSLGARLALERAEVLLRKELTPAAETALFDRFVGELRRTVN